MSSKFGDVIFNLFVISNENKYVVVLVIWVAVVAANMGIPI